MYNRYVPQPDGSYRRSRVADPQNRPSPPPPPPQAARPSRPEPQAPPCPPPEPPRESRRDEVHPCRRSPGAGDFLMGLLPKNLDTGDLLVILLLLLMAGDCPEDKNTALLTLALYLFL